MAIQKIFWRGFQFSMGFYRFYFFICLLIFFWGSQKTIFILRGSNIPRRSGPKKRVKKKEKRRVLKNGGGTNERPGTDLRADERPKKTAPDGTDTRTWRLYD